MAKKDVALIEGMGSNPGNHLVQKSRPLFALWRSDLTLSEFKILDVYLSRINSHEPERRVVRFEKAELEKLLGVKKINISELRERMKHLLSNVVEVPVPEDDETCIFRLITLFTMVVCSRDENETWQISLECSQEAMRYFFNIENLGYLRYKLRCVIGLTSRYSYVMFLYLESNRIRKSWEVDIAELKQVLNCEAEESYKQFKLFNDRILKRCHKELTEKTECQYSYETVKKGRRVAAIRFTLETLPPLDVEDPDQYTIDNFSAENDPLAFLSAALSLSGDGDSEFTKEQMQEIFTILVTIPDDKLPLCREDGIEFRRYHYLAKKYALMNRVHAQKPIKNRYAYFLKMVKSDTATT